MPRPSPRSPALPLRVAVVLDRPADRIEQALRRIDLYARTAHVHGWQQFTDRPPEKQHAAELAAGGVLRWSHGRRAVQAVVSYPDAATGGRGLPTLTVVATARQPSWLKGARLRFDLAQTPAGTVVTVEFVARQSLPLFVATSRGRVLRLLRQLLGIVTLIVHEDVVVVAAAIVKDGRVLAARRSYPAAEAGRWELPGGKSKPGETDEEALIREIQEEIGVNIRVGGRIGPAIPLGVESVLHTYRAEIVSGTASAVEHSEIAWLSGAELADVDWLTTDLELVPALRELLVGAPARAG